MVRYTGEKKKIDLSFTSVTRLILVFVIPILAYSVGLFFPLLFLYIVMKLLVFHFLINLFIFSIALVISYLILVISLVFSSAFFINIFKLKYKEGEYEKTLEEKNVFKYIVFLALYYPVYKFINVFVLPPVKSFYLSLIGAKIGKNVFLAGEEWISDPCMIEIGDNTLIGGKSMVLGHIGEEKLIIKKTKIGRNCLIGGEAFIMPGCIIEDNVIVGAKSFVLKDSRLKRNSLYAGIPVKRIK